MHPNASTTTSHPDDQPQQPNDAPLFRSAKMAAFEPPAAVRHQPPVDTHKDHGQPPLFFSKTPPPSSPSASSSFAPQPDAVLTPSAADSHPTTTTANGWDCPSLTAVGLYYPLGSCQVRLPKHLLHNVLELLPKLFQRRSYHVLEYADAPISATCRTLDRVELQVSLFASRDANDDANGLIVELERMDGDSMLFHEHTHQITAALKALGEHGTMGLDEDEGPAACASSSWSNNGLSAALDSVLPRSSEPSDSCVAEALAVAFGLLLPEQQPRYDAQRLGLESLVQLTHPQQSGWSVAQRAASALLSSSNNSNAAWQLASDTSCYDERSLLALVVLAQCLQVAAAQLLVLSDNELGQRLVPSLLAWMGQHAQAPHHAYHAAQCLDALCRLFPSALQQQQLDPVVQQSVEFGHVHHAALATASEQLWHAMLRAQA